MLAVPANRDSRPVGVLLGGSGLARMSTLRAPVAPALLKPLPCALRQSGMAREQLIAGC
jgi:hypothetical protein